jgi:hypothetical protein
MTAFKLPVNFRPVLLKHKEDTYPAANMYKTPNLDSNIQ